MARRKNTKKHLPIPAEDSEPHSSGDNLELNNSEDNSDIRKTTDGKVLSSILSRIAALEKENKELKNEANKRVEKDNRDNDMASKSVLTNIVGKNVQKNVKKRVLEVSDQSSSEESDNIEDEEDINESGQIITTPIPKPPVGKGQFANLHLNLNLGKSTAFYDLIDRHAPNEVQYKHLDKKIRAAIIRKFKKNNPHFPPCIGDWALTYHMRRYNHRHQNKKSVNNSIKIRDKVDDKRNHAPKNDKNAGESSTKLNTSNDFNDINQKIEELLKKWEALLVDARKKKQKITDPIPIDVQDGRNTTDILPFNADEHEDSDISPLLNNRDNQELELSGSILDEPQPSKKVAKKSKSNLKPNKTELRKSSRIKNNKSKTKN
ncbi:unnamed protein product [Rhizophagus irregularis]|nr:unnamed protein product [Rhizophagus irregularis]